MRQLTGRGRLRTSQIRSTTNATIARVRLIDSNCSGDAALSISRMRSLASPSANSFFDTFTLPCSSLRAMFSNVLAIPGLSP
jgi:hypothetical protein